MKVLLPITSEQTISIIPRNIDVYYDSDYSQRISKDNGIVESLSCIEDVIAILNGIEMTIIKDGEKITEILSNLLISTNGNYVDVTFSSSILEEGFGYFIELKKADNLYYRDKFFVTAQTDFTVKHKQSQENYTEYNTIDDNTYIIK